MALHAIIEYIKYRWNAKGRHGTHSPFVYDFVETILQNRSNLTISDAIVYSGLSKEHNVLLNRIRQHYQLTIVRRLPEDHIKDADIVMLPQSEPLLWDNLAKENFGYVKKDCMVFVTHIHDTAVHTSEWDKIKQNPEVKMSIDLYDAGLLLFKEEFKEQQHFILKDTA